MVPAHLVVLDKLPLTANGKLDRKALPKPDTEGLHQHYIAPCSELERVIADIWAEVLGMERVGLTDNFFDLGGHSLLALSVASMIREKTSIEVKINDLMLYPTIQDLIGSVSARASASLAVKLNGSQASVAPLFCFHPSFGTVYDYYPLATILKDRMPVYGIVSRAYVEGKWQDATWESIVDDYLNEILRVQKSGAYSLLGWSLGGDLAMEVASRLERMGKRVAFVGLIDSPPLYMSRSSGKAYPRKLIGSCLSRV